MANSFVLPVSHEWLEKTLQKGLGVHNSLEGFEQEPLTVGQGLMSFICRLRLKWSASANSQTPPVTSVIFKMPSSKPVESALAESTGKDVKEMQGNFDFITQFHKSECLFYSQFRESDPDLKAMSPACYHSQLMQGDKPGLLLIEDIPHGKVVEIMDGLNLEQVKVKPCSHLIFFFLNSLHLLFIFQNIVVQVGKLHGWSLQNDSWKGKLMEFKDVDAFKGMCLNSHHLLKKNFADVYQVTEEMINSFFSPQLIGMMFATEFKGQPIVKVMTHGDIWTTNCLFDYDPASGHCTDKLLAIIDWQNLHEGVGTEDIGRLVVSSCSVELRRKYIGEILAVYYSSFAAKLAPQQPPYTFEDLQMHYRIGLGFAALGYMFGVPILLSVAEKRGKAHLIPDLVHRAAAGIEDGYEALKQLEII